MFILTVKGFEEDGAFALETEDGDKVLLLFEEEDDAERYARLLEYEDYPDMNVVEVDDDSAIRACELYEYEYNIITPDDILVPPKNNDLLQKNKMA
jgi:hypothetical protein